MAHPLIMLINSILSLLSIGLLAYILISLMLSFQILNRSQQFVAIVYQTLQRIYEPMLRPIRRFMPDIGAIDLSPIALFLLFKFISYSLFYYF